MMLSLIPFIMIYNLINKKNKKTLKGIRFQCFSLIYTNNLLWNCCTYLCIKLVSCSVQFVWTKISKYFHLCSIREKSLALE